MPKVGGMKFGYGAKGVKAAKAYAKKTGKKVTMSGAMAKMKGGGMLSSGPKKKGGDSKRIAGARAQAQAKRSERAAGARAKARAKAARGRR